MALSLTNTTCDIFRVTTPLSSPPDVVGVPCYLEGDFRSSHEGNVANGSTIGRWTHVLLVGPTVDVRDNYAAASGSVGEDQYGGNQDQVFVPDKNGTKFLVVFVERVGRGTPQDMKRVFLQRQDVTWPSNDL